MEFIQQSPLAGRESCAPRKAKAPAETEASKDFNGTSTCAPPSISLRVHQVEAIDTVFKRLAIKEKATSFYIDLPDRPQSELPPPDEEKWLFDSKRDCFEQLSAYKSRRSAGGAA